MKSTDYWPRPTSANLTAENHFEQLRGAFYTRLRSDRARLATLSAELVRAEKNAAPVFEELRTVAHRMYGAAAIFDAPEIGRAASALEEAVLNALNTDSDNSDQQVWNALEALVDLLAAQARKVLNVHR